MRLSGLGYYRGPLRTRNNVPFPTLRFVRRTTGVGGNAAYTSLWNLLRKVARDSCRCRPLYGALGHSFLEEQKKHAAEHQGFPALRKTSIFSHLLRCSFTALGGCVPMGVRARAFIEFLRSRSFQLKSPLQKKSHASFCRRLRRTCFSLSALTLAEI